MTPEELVTLARATLLDAVAAGRISTDPSLVPDPAIVERLRVREHGDWAINVAMQLGKKTGMAPREFAQILAGDLAAADDIDSVEVTGPGFINIRLDAGAAGELVRVIAEAGVAYGRNEALSDRSINLEYVSASPIGPVYLGDAHWVAAGDSLARLMATFGAAVTHEYYFDDHGSQIDRFSYSLYVHATGREVPEDGYGGQYIADIADWVHADARVAGEPDPIILPEEEAIEVFRARGVELMFAEIKERLHFFRTNFGILSHEESLHTSGAIAAAIERLRECGEISNEDDAVWLRVTTCGDDKNRVLIKSGGQTAYFAGDVAYYLNKRERGAGVAIYLLDADHHGYIVCMMAMCAVFGDKPGENLRTLIGQLVNLVKDGEPVRIPKRADTIVTLDDLVDVVGVDTARYALVRASMNTQVDIDLGLLSQHFNDNPAYYVQYAHVRACNVAHSTAEHGVTRDVGFNPAAPDSEADEVLLAVLAQFPAQVVQATELREPHHTTRHLESLAATYHAWYGQCHVASHDDDSAEPGHTVRLWLNNAVTQVLRTGLGLSGVSAPERMWLSE